MHLVAKIADSLSDLSCMPAQNSSHTSHTTATDQGLTRAMTTRHLVMLSLGGAIGTGLFLGSGEVIGQTGPVATIIAYLLGGFIAWLVMLCLGELSVHMPVSGSFSSYASKFINPATGYMIAWLYWLTWTATLGTEFTAAALLMREWFVDVPAWLWTAAFALSIFMVNIYSTRVFAESEFFLALIKVITVIVFILLGLMAIFGFLPSFNGGNAPYLSNITSHGWFPEGLWPIFTTMLIVNFAFSGTELIGVAAGETANPAKNVPKAINAAIWRLLIFFVGTVFIISALIPYQQLGLKQGHDVSNSPFITVFSHIGIPYAEDIIRFVIITALLSTANSGLYAASRMMWSLSSEGLMPKRLSHLSKRGIPIAAVVVTMIGAMPGLLSEIYAPETIFKMLLGIAALTMVIVWMSIALSHFNFRRQFIKQGGKLSDLGYYAPAYPFVPVTAFIFCGLTGLSMALDPGMRSGFIACLLFIAACYLSYFLYYKPKLQKQRQQEM